MTDEPRTEGEPMETKAHACPKCDGQMEEGWILDLADNSCRRTSSWVKGPPAEGLLFGPVIRGKERRSVTAYRCAACGFLELYAVEPC